MVNGHQPWLMDNVVINQVDNGGEWLAMVGSMKSINLANMEVENGC